MRRPLAFAAAAALALAGRNAAADDSGFVERLRLQGGYTHLTHQAPGDDVWAGAIPELAYFTNDARSRLRLGYLFGYTLHSARPGEITNRLSLDLFRDVSPRTLFLLSTRVGQSSITQGFVTGGAPDTPFGAVPSGRTQLLTASATAAASWEVSPVVRAEEQIEARYVTPIDAPARFRSYAASATTTVEREWSRDALGVLLRGGHAYLRADGSRDQQIVTASVAPRWRRDLARSLTSSLAAGATVAASPDPGTKARLLPFGQALLALTDEDSSLSLVYTVGPRTNVTTAQLLDAHQVTLRGSLPLSYRHAVVLGASAGYLHGRRLDLRSDGARPASLDVILADADVSWTPTDRVQLFARYQFFDQTSGGAQAAAGVPTAFMRNAIIVGVQLASRTEGLAVETALPQRVDRSDAREATSRP